MRGWALDFLSTPWPALTFGLLALLALATFRPLARRLRRPPWLTLCAQLSVAIVLTLTLPPGPGARIGTPGPSGLGDCVSSLLDTRLLVWAVTATTDRGERVGNITMFVPVTFFAVLLFRRVALVAAAGVALSAAIEVSQAVMHFGRDCVGYDWVNNAIGAVLGALLGLVATRLLRTEAGRRLTRTGPGSR